MAGQARGARRPTPAPISYVLVQKENNTDKGQNQHILNGLAGSVEREIRESSVQGKKDKVKFIY